MTPIHVGCVGEIAIVFRRVAILVVVSMLLVSATFAAGETYSTYRSPQFSYAIAIPAHWGNPISDRVDGGEIISWTTASGTQLTVSARPLSPSTRGRYKSIKEIPNVIEGVLATAPERLKPKIVASGWTLLSNTDAFWVKLFLVQRALDEELWFHTYTVMTLRSETIYTILTKVPARSQSTAIARFNTEWPILKAVIASFLIYP